MSDSMTATGVRLMQEDANAQSILSERLIEESSLLRNEVLMSIFDQHPTQRIPIHPWKYNLRDMSRMLAGEIELPHAVRNIRTNRFFGVGSIEWKSSCPDCQAAIDLRVKYQQELLSKE